MISFDAYQQQRFEKTIARKTSRTNTNFAMQINFVFNVGNDSEVAKNTTFALRLFKKVTSGKYCFKAVI